MAMRMPLAIGRSSFDPSSICIAPHRAYQDAQVSAETQQQLDRELHKHEWAAFFDDLNRRLERGERLRASIEVYTLDAGGTEAEMLPLDGITYEEGDDQIAIGLGGRGRLFPAVLWHFVDEPFRVRLREQGGVPTEIRIGSCDGSQTIVHLRPDAEERQ
jgi:hypothetical protein